MRRNRSRKTARVRCALAGNAAFSARHAARQIPEKQETRRLSRILELRRKESEKDQRISTEPILFFFPRLSIRIDKSGNGRASLGVPKGAARSIWFTGGLNREISPVASPPLPPLVLAANPRAFAFARSPLFPTRRRIVSRRRYAAIMNERGTRCCMRLAQGGGRRGTEASRSGPTCGPTSSDERRRDRTRPDEAGRETGKAARSIRGSETTARDYRLISCYTVLRTLFLSAHLPIVLRASSSLAHVRRVITLSIETARPKRSE